MQQIEHQLTIPESMAESRLDKALAQLLPQYSRAKLVSWLKLGQVELDNKQLPAKFKVQGGESITIKAMVTPLEEHLPEPMDLDIIFEDEHLLVINKPADLVVHPAAGHHSGTLLNGLLAHCPALDNMARAGIVHRLDKDTTGLMVVAKNIEAHTALVKMLQNRDIQRYYLAVVQGYMIAGGSIQTQFGRHPSNRLKMAVVKQGKDAVTHYRVVKRFDHYSLIEVKLDTGRTHQIRVHMHHIQYPIVGDQLYTGRVAKPKGCDESLSQTLNDFKRQALHAYKLQFEHPITKAPLAFEAPVPDDMRQLVMALKQHDNTQEQ